MTSPLVQILAEANRQSPAPTPANVYPTNVAGIYNNYDQAQMDAYKAQLAQQNANFGGLASLGSAGISALPKLLGGGGGGGAAMDGTVKGAVGATSLGGAPLVAGSGSGGLAALLGLLA